MTAERRVQFGHSDSERLVLGNFKWGDGSYTLDADVRVGSFKGAVSVYGFEHELTNLHEALLGISSSLSGEVNFENLEGQLNIRCAIGTTGTVHFEVVLTDYPNRIECSFNTDPTGLDSTIEALGHLV